MSAPDLERDSAPPSAPPRSWRPLILRLHFYAAILVAPFILLATVSGGLYAVAPTFEQVVYRDYLHVESTGPSVPVSQQIEVARAERPDLTVTGVRPATDPGETTRVLFTDPSLGESEKLAVFVDPVTAQSVGELAVYGSSSALPLRTWISELHRHLHLGEPGRLYSELAASWLWVIALGGVYLWFERARRRKTSLLSIDRTATGRGRTLNRHGAVGMWIAVGLIFLSATGLTWSTYAGANVTELRSSLSWNATPLATAVGGAGAEMDHAGHEGHGAMSSGASDPLALETSIAAVDTALDVAAANGIDGKVEVTVPDASDTAITVAQTRQPWVLSNNSIAIDPVSGSVVDTQWFADWPIMAKLAAWGIQLHMGTLFGVANQLALLALAIALGTVIVRGYLMWWQRRPRGGTVGRTPQPGGWRRVPPLGLVALGVSAAVVGWFVPLLGASLVAFLMIDVVVQRCRH